MMKMLIQLTACVLLTGLTAQALPPVKKKAKAVAAAPYLRVQHEYLRIHQELATCLQTVQNIETADAAAATVKNLTEQLRILLKEEQNLPPAPKHIRAYILQQTDANLYKAATESGVGKALDLIMMHESPCYGSSQLESALNEILECLCDGNLK